MEEVKIGLSREILHQEYLFNQYELAYRDYVKKHPRQIPTKILRDMVRKGKELETLHIQMIKLVSK